MKTERDSYTGIAKKLNAVTVEISKNHLQRAMHLLYDAVEMLSRRHPEITPQMVQQMLETMPEPMLGSPDGKWRRATVLEPIAEAPVFLETNPFLSMVRLRQAIKLLDRLALSDNLLLEKRPTDAKSA